MAKKGEPSGAPLVEGSGQAWKVTLAIGAMSVAAAASVLQFAGPAGLKRPAIAVAVVSGLAGIAALIAVRCPACGLSLGVWAFRTGSLTTWQERLVTAAACPSCGHRAPTARGRQR